MTFANPCCLLPLPPSSPACAGSWFPGKFAPSPAPGVGVRLSSLWITKNCMSICVCIKEKFHRCETKEKCHRRWKLRESGLRAAHQGWTLGSANGVPVTQNAESYVPVGLSPCAPTAGTTQPDPKSPTKPSPCIPIATSGAVPEHPGARADPALLGRGKAGGTTHAFPFPRLCHTWAAAAAQAMAGSSEALALHVLLCCLCGGKRECSMARHSVAQPPGHHQQ